LLSTVLWSVNHIVKLDGTGDYTSIQAAIDVSAHGDTVLVYPGTYYENINYSGKNITVASLELTTGNPAYRDSTFIDGNNNGSCVRVESNEDGAVIYGFTIQHGSGTTWWLFGANTRQGGGIRIYNAVYVTISNCIIRDNQAYEGGGIWTASCSVFLKNNIICHNYASGGGGGILFGGNMQVTFDAEGRCSVYENYAGLINDIMAASSGCTISVYLDISTVTPPSDYYICFTKLTPDWPGGFDVIDVQQGYRTEVNHDLYLAPDGDDNNDGLTPATPKQSIGWALHTIASDSLNPKTIHLAPGTYSSQEGQIFPLNMKPHVNLIGDSLQIPVLVNESYLNTIMSYFAPGNTIANLILEHGEYHPFNVFTVYKSDNTIISNIAFNPVQAITFAGITINKSKCEIDNLRLEGLISSSQSGISYWGSYLTLKNSSINNCHTTGDEGVPVMSMIHAELDSTFVVENTSITNCSIASDDIGLINIGNNQFRNPDIKLSNMLIANNTTNGVAPLIVDAVTNNPMEMTNCSLVNNVGSLYAANIAGWIDVSNCIFDNDTWGEINIRETQQYGFVSHMNFRNNLIRDYPASVYVHPSNDVTFNGFNFDADPSFAGSDWTDPLSYRLNHDSPCIDAGTPDTTGLYLPSFDLYGNPRIYNGIIDIGCNEWNGTAHRDSTIPLPSEAMALQAYPNPFYPSTTIAYTVPKDGEVRLNIYNLKGQLVKTLVSEPKKSGSYKIIWNGEDQAGNKVSSGLYFTRIESNGKSLTNKMLMLK